MLIAALWLAALLQQAPTPASAEARRLEEARWPEILAAMQLRPGQAVADLGSGDGDFTLPLARTVGPRGHVYAVDIDEGALKRLGARLVKDGAANVTAVHGSDEDPRLTPASLDAVLIRNALH